MLSAPDQGVAQLAAVEGQAGVQIGHVKAHAVYFLNQWDWERIIQMKPRREMVIYNDCTTIAEKSVW